MKKLIVEKTITRHNKSVTKHAAISRRKTSRKNKEKLRQTHIDVEKTHFIEKKKNSYTRKEDDGRGDYRSGIAKKSPLLSSKQGLERESIERGN